jgi:hypothetical protein
MAIATALPATATAPLSPAHALVLPVPAQIAFAMLVAVGTVIIIALIAIMAPITRRFVFIDLL